MNELILEWQEVAHLRTQTICDQQPSKNPGTFRIGRDPARCDLVLTHPTVSGLHIEIFFNPSLNCFQVRNLRDSNPPLVEGQMLRQGERILEAGTTLELGQVKLRVVAVALAESSVPPTILIPPRPSPNVNQATPTAAAEPIYGLQCPHCDRLSPYERLNLGCPWCGTSLAAAASVLIDPANPSNR